MKTLIMVGFGDRHRALEVLPQLRRLQCEWSADLNDAVVVEVEKDGRLRLLSSVLLDPVTGWEDASLWKTILSVIVPVPHLPSSSTPEVNSEVYAINVKGRDWLAKSYLDGEFVRDAASLLQPGNSAILATIQDWQSAAKVLLEYGAIVLHTPLVQIRGGDLNGAMA